MMDHEQRRLARFRADRLLHTFTTTVPLSLAALFAIMGLVAYGAAVPALSRPVFAWDLVWVATALLLTAIALGLLARCEYDSSELVPDEQLPDFNWDAS